MIRIAPDKNPDTECNNALLTCAPAVERFMAHPEAQKQVIEAWLRLPETRRRHATDAVAFAYRFLQEQPALFAEWRDSSYELILGWIKPYLGPEQAAY